MTIHPTDPDDLPPISACFDPVGLAAERIDYCIGEAWAKRNIGQRADAYPYAFQWGDDYGPTLWFPLPPATITPKESAQ